MEYVYLVYTSIPYEGGQIHGICSSQEEAEKLKMGCQYNSDISIVKIKLNEPKILFYIQERII